MEKEQIRSLFNNPDNIVQALEHLGPFLDEVQRWQDSNYQEIKESNLDHTLQCLKISRCLFNKLEWLTNYVDSNIVNLMIIVHDIGESENGDLTVNQQLKMTFQELKANKKLEVPAGIKTINDSFGNDSDNNPYFRLVLLGFFLNYEAREASVKPPFKKEACLAKLTDVLDGSTTYLSTHKETAEKDDIIYSLTRIREALRSFVETSELDKDEKTELTNFIIKLVSTVIPEEFELDIVETLTLT